MLPKQLTSVKKWVIIVKCGQSEMKEQTVHIQIVAFFFAGPMGKGLGLRGGFAKSNIYLRGKCLKGT